MIIQSDIDFICTRGLRTKVTQDKNDNTRLNIDLFDFDVLDILEDKMDVVLVSRAINNFVLTFAVTVNLKDTLDGFRFQPFDDLLIAKFEHIIQEKIYEYENIHGVKFSKLLSIHIFNYVHGCLLETGHVQ
ncbi:hypothetical protein CHOTACABRAS_65 [Bacillus phage Chotacabras]|nr:hypothetical protein CHOTACABRAS_65 [Bacillus phage Chotacabras]